MDEVCVHIYACLISVLFNFVNLICSGWGEIQIFDVVFPFWEDLPQQENCENYSCWFVRPKGQESCSVTFLMTFPWSIHNFTLFLQIFITANPKFISLPVICEGLSMRSWAVLKHWWCGPWGLIESSNSLFIGSLEMSPYAY